MNQKHLKFIFTELELGSPMGSATRIYGSRAGSIMWRVNTENGSYAIKQLSPDLDLNNERIVAKYELSETIAYRFMQRGISAVPAIEKSGKRLIIIENTGYLVYPWIKAYTLSRNEISETHAIKIAEMIANLHKIDLNIPEIGEPHFDIHANDHVLQAIDKSTALNCSFAKALCENQKIIFSMNDHYIDSIPLLKEDTVVTHGDIDQLNILWDKENKPILIDWESARKLNPTREVVRASLAWSGIGTENFSLPLYIAMLHTYTKSGGMLKINHLNPALNAMFGSMLNWLLYNIEHTCGSVTSEERDTAINEVNWVLESILRLKRLIPNLLKID